MKENDPCVNSHRPIKTCGCFHLPHRNKKEIRAEPRGTTHEKMNIQLSAAF